MKDLDDAEPPRRNQESASRPAADNGRSAAEQRLIRTTGRGEPGDETMSKVEAAAIDVAWAALEHLGQILELGHLQRVAMVFNAGPIAVARDGDGDGTITAIGRRGEVPGALLALLRKLATSPEKSS